VQVRNQNDFINFESTSMAKRKVEGDLTFVVKGYLTAYLPSREADAQKDIDASPGLDLRDAVPVTCVFGNY
jgi:hypothetical protein